MDLLTELMRVKRIDDEKEEKEPDMGPEADPKDDGADLPDDAAGEEGQGEEFDDDDVTLGSDEPDLDEPGAGAGYGDAPAGGDADGFEDPELDDIAGDDAELGGEDPAGGSEDPNRAGVIRYVKGAHLVYKREQEDGTYEEMWIFNSGEFKKDMNVKKAILAGTDIPVNATASADGAQEMTMWSAGNADIVLIKGLPQ